MVMRMHTQQLVLVGMLIVSGYVHNLYGIVPLTVPITSVSADYNVIAYNAARVTNNLCTKINIVAGTACILAHISCVMTTRLLAPHSMRPAAARLQQKLGEVARTRNEDDWLVPYANLP